MLKKNTARLILIAGLLNSTPGSSGVLSLTWCKGKILLYEHGHYYMPIPWYEGIDPDDENQLPLWPTPLAEFFWGKAHKMKNYNKLRDFLDGNSFPEPHIETAEDFVRKHNFPKFKLEEDSYFRFMSSSIDAYYKRLQRICKRLSNKRLSKIQQKVTIRHIFEMVTYTAWRLELSLITKDAPWLEWKEIDESDFGNIALPYFNKSWQLEHFYKLYYLYNKPPKSYYTGLEYFKFTLASNRWVNKNSTVKELIKKGVLSSPKNSEFYYMEKFLSLLKNSDFNYTESKRRRCKYDLRISYNH